MLMRIYISVNFDTDQFDCDESTFFDPNQKTHNYSIIK